jgi:uncharacterized protein YecE (DUF72 family)
LGDLRIGTSGWSYKEWEGVFYPKGEKNKLGYYSRYFDTVEMDSTFYAYPKKAMIQNCARLTPEQFLFTAKVPKLITHDKKLSVDKGVARDVHRFIHDLKPLSEAHKLGILLLQLPPAFNYDNGLGRLIHFLEVLPSDPQFAIEFRNRSWMRPETWDLLKKCSIAYTIVDEPLLPPDIVVTANFSLVRFHGHGQKTWYNYRYSNEEIKNWVPKIQTIEASALRTFVYFNNHYNGASVTHALTLLEELGRATPSQVEKRKATTRAIDHLSASPDQMKFA